MRYPKVLGSLYVQVVIGIALGVLLGFAAPEYGAAMRPLGDGFIKLIKMLIAPIIFTTVTVGIAQMGHMKDVGRIGVRALVYFEVVSTAALLIGLVVVNVLKPGAGLHIDPGQLDATAVAAYTSTAQHLGPVDFILGVIPTTIADAFARGEVLQVLLVSVLTGLAMLSLGERIRPLTSLVEQVSKVLFAMVAMIMRLAPIGAFGAMAFTIGKYGLGTLLSLGQLMAGVYLTCLLFVFVVLAGILRSCRFNIVDVLAYIKEEILVVLGTASSESVLPRIMAKLEDLGCAKPVVGLVVPTGYSFNLDGTSIYMTMAAVFVAQATGVNLSLRQELSILAILLLTSKGAAAVTGSGFITL
ncbi:MAG: C4-dicarboxylate transporter DctA, partial [Acidobacteria bacterium]|nr:C4-dicarboxylate transporter DctA [Acidobacteriota bacterium]